MADDPTRAFERLLARVRREVDRRLRALWIRKLREVRRYEPGVIAMVETARDLTLRGGKRYRAAVLLAAYTGIAGNTRTEPAFGAGVALELMQSYLLIQDDWMDGDSTRRGGPSAHAALERALGDAHVGASSAILASDFTFGLALSTLAAVEVSPARRVDALQELCRFHEDVVIGQQMDMLGQARDVELMHALKTASYTVRGPLALGAALAGARQRVRRELERYAAPVGVAFQLRDDLLGTFASSARTGKPEGGDLFAGKRTSLIVEAQTRLDREGRRALARVLGHRDAGPRALRSARVALERCGARASVEQRLAELCSEAETLASKLPIEAHGRAQLIGAASMLRLRGAWT
jgi:geranylgeranyl diphosphate synthase type I